MAAGTAVRRETCLCALYPDHWSAYAGQLHRWLAPGGRLFALFVQILRPGAAEGLIQGPPYHCDIHGMRALFPADRWDWPKPPYPPTCWDAPKPATATGWNVRRRRCWPLARARCC